MISIAYKFVIKTEIWVYEEGLNFYCLKDPYRIPYAENDQFTSYFFIDIIFSRAATETAQGYCHAEVRYCQSLYSIET